MLEIQYRPLKGLVPYAKNSRTHSAASIAKIAGSLASFGWTNPMLIAENTMIAGHARLSAALQMAERGIPIPLNPDPWQGPTIDLSHLTKHERAAYVIADNRLALDAGWDQELLSEELGWLSEDGFDLNLIGFEEDELASMLGGTPPGGNTDPDDIPETPVHPVTKLGDVWILGRHRLVCGDSTDPAVVSVALAGVKPLLCVTDPPYGVDYDPVDRGKARNADGKLLSTGMKRAVGKVQNDDRSNWREAFDLFPGDVAYVWHAAINPAAAQRMLEDAGFEIRMQIIWAKSAFVVSRGHYHMQHEPCQPAGTMVTKVVSSWADALGLPRAGVGRRPSYLEEVPIETLQAGDKVVSYAAGKIWRAGKPITSIGRREYSGNLHSISVGDLCTRATAEHQFTVRFNPKAADKFVIYLMRCGLRWRIGTASLYNSRGFGPSVRLSQEKGDSAWILSVHDDLQLARAEEQALSCIYGIPTTHWVTANKPPSEWPTRGQEHIAGIYKRIGIDRLRAGVHRLLSDFGLSEEIPLITQGYDGRFSREQTTTVRSCNLIPEIMQLPIPTEGEDYEWRSISEVTFQHFVGPVYSMDVERDQHYIADGIVTHNCYYAVRINKTAHWTGDRKQSTLWTIEKQPKNMTGHSTEKPVECMVRPIENNSSPGQVVYDPFVGSGTTVMAAEITGRACIAIEISPAFVDVAIKRWQNYTLGAAVLEGTDKTYEDMALDRPFNEADEAAE